MFILESLLVLIIPKSEEVYADVLPKLDASQGFHVAPMSLMIDKTYYPNSYSSLAKNNDNSSFLIKFNKEYISIDDYDLIKSEMEDAIKEYEEKKSYILYGTDYISNAFNLSYKTDSDDVWSIAEDLIGTRGSCLYICQLFIYEYTGEWRSFSDIVTTDSPEPGDLIYYANGGVGYEHWAIYLGGESALQGNYNGTTVIGSIYLRHASSPVFYKFA